MASFAIRACAVLLAAVPALAAIAAPAPGAAALHAADCVAALRARETALVAALRPGTPADAELLDVVRGGIAIIGTQYLAGVREAEARQMLQAAEASFRALPPRAAEERQAACRAEGRSLYAGASSIERSLITTAAQKRIRRLRGA